MPDVKCCLEDRRGNVPLHFAASANCPMAAYAIAKSCPQSCLARNKAGKTPADLAKASNLGEVSLNCLKSLSRGGLGVFHIALFLYLIARTSNRTAPVVRV